MSRNRQAYGKPLDGSRSTGVRWCRKSSGVGHGCHPCPVFVGPPQDHEETMTLAETEDSTSSFIYQEANYQPGRTWRTWLIGRPLSTADAPHQTIGKADRVGGLCLRCALLDGLCDAGDHDNPGGGGHDGLRPRFPDFYGDCRPAGNRDPLVRADHPRLSRRRRRLHRGARQPGRTARPNRRRGAADRLHPDGSGIHFIRRGPDRLRRFQTCIRIA